MPSQIDYKALFERLTRRYVGQTVNQASELRVRGRVFSRACSEGGWLLHPPDAGGHGEAYWRIRLLRFRG